MRYGQLRVSWYRIHHSVSGTKQLQ